jgi:hypothetical protein
MKKKIPKGAVYTISSMIWCNCPYCKKPLVLTEKPEARHLRKWSKLKNKRKLND